MAASLLVAIVDRFCWGLMAASLLVAIVDKFGWGRMAASLRLPSIWCFLKAINSHG